MTHEPFDDDAQEQVAICYLEHYPEQGEVHRTHLNRFPFVLGRSQGADYVIRSRQVSSQHVQVEREGLQYRIRDLGSRNGTFVNGQKTTDKLLMHGDIIHVAHKEFRFVLEIYTADDSDELTAVTRGKERRRLVRESQSLIRIFKNRAVRTVFQPVVLLADGSHVGYEALARSNLADVEYSPVEMLRIAAERTSAAKMSRLMRERALEEVPRLPLSQAMLFINLHPSEMDSEESLSELDTLAARLPRGYRVYIEIHESAVSSIERMKTLKSRFTQAGFGLVYDDFGAGQSRLREICEVPPDVVKVDISLVRDIHRNPRRQQLVGAFTKVMTAMGIRILAEGIEAEEERRVCMDLGCELGQGFLFSRPRSAKQLHSSQATSNP